jgi:hypothetical protein
MVELQTRRKLIIRNGDVQRILEVTERQARNKMRQIRHYFKKEKHQVITVKEFCDYIGLQYEDVISRI